MNNTKFKIGDLIIANENYGSLALGTIYKVVGYSDSTDDFGVRNVKVTRINSENQKVIGGYFQSRFSLYKKHTTIKKII